MAHPFPAAMLAQVVAHLLTQCGFTSFSQATVHVLVDVLERYLAAAGSRAAAVAELSGRSHVQLLDTVVALHALGEDATALHEFVHAGWTKPLANLDVDLRLEKVPRLPVPVGAAVAQGRGKDVEEREVARVQATGFPLHVSHNLLRDYFQSRPSLDAVLVVDPTPAPAPEPDTEPETRIAAVAAETADEPMAVDGPVPAAAATDPEPPVRSPPLAPTSPSLAPPPPLPLPLVPTAHYDAAHFPAHIPTHLPPFPAADAVRHDDFHLPFPASALPPPPAASQPPPPTASPKRKKIAVWTPGTPATATADTTPALQHLDRTAILALHSKPIRVPNPKTGSMAALATTSAPAPRPNPKPSAYLRKRQGKGSGQAAALQRAMRAADRANAETVAPEAPTPGAGESAPPATENGTESAAAAAAPPPPTPSASSPAPLVGPRTAPTPAIAGGTAILKPLHRRAVVLATANDALFCARTLDRPEPAVPVARGPDEIRCMCDHARNDDGGFMVACDACHVWFHGKCVGVALGVLQDGDRWVCPRCTRAGRGFK
ncbi:hypothetical protein AMAG_11624 [Allomyces macrogynus ATCC 38327]|uniref:PHD-type domain-containing protein n=1 Tax=Allomyces macrogynus (strain ATCC 38327) TaxID=578462 RepID=A0A0L0SVK9_ALLM3|nr:hypothetical protein AMAG_11624 [Allomyces macrogynus ATCC 38327]|eukprot:KNE66486.1 hypothetical protein AMAG_11624 [Allomyces macrogynus ATCC 38327]